MAEIKFKYQFTILNKCFLLAMHETAIVNQTDIVKIEKYASNGLMNTLYISINNGAWLFLEQGKRTVNGKLRNDFKRIKIN